MSAPVAGTHWDLFFTPAPHAKNQILHSLGCPSNTKHIQRKLAFAHSPFFWIGQFNFLVPFPSIPLKTWFDGQFCVNLSNLCPDIWSDICLYVAVKVFFLWCDSWFNQETLNKANYPSIMWWVLSDSWRPYDQRLMSSKEERILQVDCLWTHAATLTLPCISSLQAHPSELPASIIIWANCLK